MRRSPLVVTSAYAFVLALSAACPPAQDTTPTCAAYCASVTQNCTGGAAQYASEADCVAFCDANNLTWGVGTTADAAGNTLGCRQYHAGAAANDDHCAHAGPTGGGACGTYCDVYCDAALNNCTADNQLYADTETCHAICEHFPDNGNVNAAEGDSVQCRLYHLGAAKAAPADHCAHGSASGADTCGTWCQVYCDTILDACDGSYTGPAACQTACEGFADDGNIDDATGDTVQCRIFHASVANNDDHCDHASEESTAETCGGGGGGDDATCATYCATITANCTGASEQYADEAECLAFCDDNAVHWTEGGTVADSGDHSLACREFHAGAANDDSHCEHAGPTGGAVCGDLCEVYCHAMTTYCTASYADYAACETACAAFPTDGNVNDPAGDTVQCRIYHAGFAVNDQAHCDHADADSAATTCQ